MKFKLLILSFFLSINLFAQEDSFQKLETEAIQALNSGEYQKALDNGLQIYGSYPQLLNPYLIISNSLLRLGNHTRAEGYIANGLALDPTNFTINVNAGYWSAMAGKKDDAKLYFLETIKLFPKDLEPKTVVEEMRTIGKETGHSAVFNELAQWYEQAFANTKQRYLTLDSANFAIQVAGQRDPASIKTIADSFAAQFTALSWPELALTVYTNASIELQRLGFPSEALDVAQAGYKHYLQHGYRTNAFHASLLLYQLMSIYQGLGNDERALQHLNEVVSLSDKLSIHVYDVSALILGAGVYHRMTKYAEARQMGELAYKLAEQAGYRYGACVAANSLCVAYLFVNVNNSVYYGEYALQFAMKYVYEDLVGSVMGNLAVSYFQVGTSESHEKCATMYANIIRIYKEKKEYAKAFRALNNSGALYFQSREYEFAAKQFEEAIQMGELAMGVLSDRDKLTFHQSHITAYQFLTACYAQLKNTEKVFQAMEGSRSRVLTERLAKGKSVKPASLSDLQAILKPDEAAILYSLFTADEVIILVVTKKYAQVLFHQDENFIGAIKAKYLDRMNTEHRERKGQELNEGDIQSRGVQMSDFHKVAQLTRKFFEKPGLADDILNEYLQGYYKFLILPVANRLTGIKRLLISPDDVLNYIPFEALRTFDGKYLIEKYQVRYLHSTGALKQIEARQYAVGRKPLLAMGGAVYQELKIQAPPLKTQEDLNALQLEAEENDVAGRSQRKAYAALFGTRAMNPLPGTLAEVKGIAGTVPSAQVFTGADMTEERIKTLSRTGELGNYKVLHLATHGFVVNEIPDLSGIAMSIFETEQNGEDGFLNVSEIAELKLQTDLTVLSACQTALGKIYSGEGVTGLTQSLLVAGSNAALVSLWPVNDNSTMLFMDGLYKESAKGKSYSDVVAELKRKFIKGEFGEEFRHPNYWAPFVYFGK